MSTEMFGIEAANESQQSYEPTRREPQDITQGMYVTVVDTLHDKTTGEVVAATEVVRGTVCAIPAARESNNGRAYFNIVPDDTNHGQELNFPTTRVIFPHASGTHFNGQEITATRHFYQLIAIPIPKQQS